jgi:uncharacterized membrane protein YedE/YeeE
VSGHRESQVRPAILAYLSGALFGVGLAVSGMTQPAKVVAFLDVFGAWDPSLAFVMGGAIAVYMPLYRRVARMRSPILGSIFSLPTRKDIDAKLLIGAALFGVGWALGGFCPGPALTSVGTLSTSALVFVAALIAGSMTYQLLHERQVRTPKSTTTC